MKTLIFLFSFLLSTFGFAAELPLVISDYVLRTNSTVTATNVIVKLHDQSKVAVEQSVEVIAGRGVISLKLDGQSILLLDDAAKPLFVNFFVSVTTNLAAPSHRSPGVQPASSTPSPTKPETKPPDKN